MPHTEPQNSTNLLCCCLLDHVIAFSGILCGTCRLHGRFATTGVCVSYVCYELLCCLRPFGHIQQLALAQFPPSLKRFVPATMRRFTYRCMVGKHLCACKRLQVSLITQVPLPSGVTLANIGLIIFNVLQSLFAGTTCVLYQSASYRARANTYTLETRSLVSRFLCSCVCICTCK